MKPVISHHAQAESQTLEQLAARLDRKSLTAWKSQRTARQEMAECGDILNEIRAKVGHGNFSPWLVQNFRFSERTAFRWLRIRAELKEKDADILPPDDLEVVGEAKTDTVSVLNSPEPDAPKASTAKRPPRAKAVPESEDDEQEGADESDESTGRKTDRREGILVDWTGFNLHFGWFVRAMDQLARGVGLVDESGGVVGDVHYHALKRRMEEFEHGFKQWFRSVTGERPPR